MRTGVLLAGWLVVLTATVAAAEGSETGSAPPIEAPPIEAPSVEAVGLLNLKTAKGTEPSSGSPSAPEPQVASASQAVLAPVGALSENLVELGLRLLAGFFAGVGEAAHTMDVAWAVVAEAPLTSLGAGAVTLSLLGLLGALAAALHRYGSLGALPLFSRIAKHQLLDHGVRAQIFDAIRATPGINASELSRRLNVAWGTVTHHLAKLRAERLIALRLVGRQKCYFPNGGAYTPVEMDVMSATKHPTARRIAEHLVAHGARGHREICDALRLSPALVSFHARKLVAAGVLDRKREGRRSLYGPLQATLSPTPRPALHL